MILFRYISLIFLIAGSITAEEIIDTRFRMFSLDETINHLCILSGDKLIDVTIPNHTRSPGIHYVGPKEIKFFNKSDYLNAPDHAQPVAVVSINQDVSKSLFVFHPYPQSIGASSKYHVIKIEEDSSLHAGGSIRFINLTRYNLKMFLEEDGNKRFEMNPLGRVIYNLNDDFENNLRIRIASEDKGSIHKGFDNRLFPSKHHIDIYFISSLIGNKPGLVQLHLLREHEVTERIAYMAPEKTRG